MPPEELLCCEVCGDEPDDPEDLVACETCDWLMCNNCKSTETQCKVCLPPKPPYPVEDGLEPVF